MGWIEVVFGISVQGSLSFPLKAHESVNLQTPGSEASINTTHKPSDLRLCMCYSCFLSALIGHLSKAATYLPIFAFRFYIPKWAPVHQNTPAFKLFLMMFRSLDTNLTSLFPFEKESNSCSCSKCTWEKNLIHVLVTLTFQHPVQMH